LIRLGHANAYEYSWSLYQAAIDEFSDAMRK
jgi:hypothetical protein